MAPEKWRLDGRDLAILAGREPGLRPSAAAARRARLRRQKLLESSRQGMQHRHDSPLRAAAGGLLAARPSLIEELRSIHVDMLAAQFAFEDRALESNRSRLQWLCGASASAARSAFEDLRDANLILEQPAPALNPNLAALRSFLEALQAQASLAPDSHEAVTIHAAGMEAAWAMPHANPALQDVATQEPFQGLLMARRIQYRGPRRLDRWDHAFLFLLGDARRGHANEASARTKAAVLAAMSPRLAFNESFSFRAAFYGLSSFIKDARAVLATDHPFREHVEEYRRHIDVGPGWLDAR